MDAVIALVAVALMFIFMGAIIGTALSKIFGFYELIGDAGDELARSAGHSLRAALAKAGRKRG